MHREMITVYLDSQIFRHLKNKNEVARDLNDAKRKALFQRLHHHLELNVPNLLLFYSHAHLLDLKCDKTEKKYEDLIYMEKWVQDNLIIFYFKHRDATYDLKTPLKAFHDLEDDESGELDLDFDSLFNLDHLKETLEPDALNALEEHLNTLRSLQFPTNEDWPGLESTLQEDRDKLVSILPFLKGGSMMDILKGTMDGMKRFQTDNRVYKDLRGIVAAGVNRIDENVAKLLPEEQKYLVDLAKLDGSEENKIMFVQKGLMNAVQNALRNQKIENAAKFDLHYHAYVQLDLFGIQKDKNKKLKAASLLNDAQHSFYGGHCQIVVSDDIEFREKSKLLYRLFGLTTKVYDIEEFIAEAFRLRLNANSLASDFIDHIILDLNHSLIKQEYFDLPAQQTKVIQCSGYYFGYFNKMRVIIENGKSFVVLRHHSNTYLTALPYKVIASVTDKAFGTFGPDSAMLGPYD